MDRTSWIVIGVAALIIVLLVGLLLLIVAGAGLYCFVLQPGTCFAAAPVTGAGGNAITGGTGTNAGTGTGKALDVLPKTKEPAVTGDDTPAAGVTPPAEVNPPVEEPAAEPEPTLNMALKLGDPTYWCKDGSEIMLKSVGIENISGKDFDYSGIMAFSIEGDEAEGNTEFKLKAGDDSLINMAVVAGKTLDTGNNSSVDFKLVFKSDGTNGTYLTKKFSTASAPCN